jgi:hypothetical protein
MHSAQPASFWGSAGGRTGGYRQKGTRRQTWPANPPVRINCGVASPAAERHSRTTPVHPPPAAQVSRTRTAPQQSQDSTGTEELRLPDSARRKPAQQQAGRQSRPHGKGCLPESAASQWQDPPKGRAKTGRRRVATGANHPASRSSAFRRGPGTPAAVPRRGTRAPI